LSGGWFAPSGVNGAGANGKVDNAGQGENADRRREGEAVHRRRMASHPQGRPQQRCRPPWPPNGRRLGLQKVGGVGWARTRNRGARAGEASEFWTGTFFSEKKHVIALARGGDCRRRDRTRQARRRCDCHNQKNVHSLVFLVFLVV